MEEKSNNNYPETLEGLIKEMEAGNYKHLQIFLYRDKPNHRYDEDVKYLVVSNQGFGLYRLHSIDYNEGKIQLEFLNPDTGSPTKVNLDIKNIHPDIFVISWKDIADLVNADQTYCDNELL